MLLSKVMLYLNMVILEYNVALFCPIQVCFCDISTGMHLLMLIWTVKAYWQEKMGLLLDYITDAKIVFVF